MSESSQQHSDDTPDSLVEYLEDGSLLTYGDQVVIMQVIDDDEAGQYGITDESYARYTGSFVLTMDGETLFDGDPVPRFEVELEDGSTIKLMGYDCFWCLPKEHALLLNIVQDDVAQDIEGLN